MDPLSLDKINLDQLNLDETKPCENKIVTFNVGGTLFSTTMDNLATVKNNLLYVLATDSQFTHLSKDGNIFIDRDPKFFQEILNFFRNRKYNFISDNENIVDNFKNEIKYYCMPEYNEYNGIIYLQNRYKCDVTINSRCSQNLCMSIQYVLYDKTELNVKIMRNKKSYENDNKCDCGMKFSDHYDTAIIKCQNEHINFIRYISRTGSKVYNTVINDVRYIMHRTRIGENIDGYDEIFHKLFIELFINDKSTNNLIKNRFKKHIVLK